MPNDATVDVLVIGSGAAGLTLALCVADRCNVAVVSKARIDSGSTNWAQGGIAAVLSATDSFESHVEDTLVAGGGLCDVDAVKFTVEEGPAAIQWLIDQGMLFDTTKKGPYHLTREGGHSHRRVIHSKDATGKAVQRTLDEQARAHPNIRVLEDYVAVDLINRDADGARGPCRGAYLYDQREYRVKTFAAKAVVIATGGASRVYLYTSNPDGSTGDGIAMAWRAGCRVANMEFNQFHPTCLFHPEARTFLITEAVRGEGGRLLLPNGERFMKRFDPRGELAPRDIVARAIDHEIKRLGIDCVYLDISHKKKKFIKEHFPTIYKQCRKYGIDITEEPIPVVPAAHYTCGGVMVDRAGRTDVDSLYCIGEASYTGLHGANRMASNSLLECIVYATSAAEDILSKLDDLPPPPDLKPWDESRVTNSDEEVVVSHNWDELRRTMWNYVGIVRTDKRLRRAQRRIDLLREEIQEYYGNFRVTPDLLELRNLVTVGDLIVKSAAGRKESRGLHYTLDYPDALPSAEPTVLVPE
ncbi:MAG: L-aspartate oxidase [Alphaproteobacteria bacterium]|nr:L-aspartate oxidase [Alphaproteobacteria bacterium]